MKIIISFLLCITFSFSFGQSVIKGIVLDRESKQPIHGATVYINNSSAATSTAKDGRFQLHQKVIQNQELIISNIGYEPAFITITNSNYDKIKIYLERKTTTLEEVNVVPFEKDGWAKWGKYFTESFIGTSKFAQKTKILNPDMLRFRYNKSSKILTVVAKEPIQIDNKELGYFIAYDLISFRSNFSENTIQFEGFSYFKDYKRIDRSKRKRRREAYQLSMMRFIRSLYEHKWQEDGYVVRELTKKENLERKDAQGKLKTIVALVNNKYEGNWNSFYILQSEIVKDSVTKYQNIMRQPAFYDVLGKRLTESDLEKGSLGNQSKEVHHQNYIHIINNNQKIDLDYFNFNDAYDESSRLKIADDSSIIINDQGNYSPATQWSMEGFFAWYSKVGNMLPLDYIAQENNK